jgi:hypothetical protein
MIRPTRFNIGGLGFLGSQQSKLQHLYICLSVAGSDPCARMSLQTACRAFLLSRSYKCTNFALLLVDLIAEVLRVVLVIRNNNRPDRAAHSTCRMLFARNLLNAARCKRAGKYCLFSIAHAGCPSSVGCFCGLCHGAHLFLGMRRLEFGTLPRRHDRHLCHAAFITFVQRLNALHRLVARVLKLLHFDCEVFDLGVQLVTLAP